MFFMLQWCDRVNHHLCVDHQFCIHCERKTSSSALFNIVVSSCLCFLLYKDKSPDKLCKWKSMNLSRFVYCFISKRFHPALLAAFPLSFLPLSKLYLVLLSCWWLLLRIKHASSAIPVLKTSLLITSKHHRCVYLSSWHLFSITSSQSYSLITFGTIKVLGCVAKQGS